MFGDDGLCKFLKIPRPAVVAETFPGLEDGSFVRSGEGGEIWESRQPAGVVVASKDGGDLSLLKHDFRDEDGVGVLGLPPRVVASMGLEPSDELVGQELEVGWLFHEGAAKSG